MSTKNVLFWALIGLILINGCTKSASISKEDRAVPYDEVTMEATILSLTKLDLCPREEEICSVATKPSDHGDIRIDKIIEHKRNPEIEYDSFVESQEARAGFVYTARPAKVRCVSLEAQISEQYYEENKSIEKEEPKLPKSLSDSEIEKLNKIPIEDGYYVYTYYTAKCPPEKVLPGLEEGNRIRFTLQYVGYGISVGEYEIIS